MAAVSTKVLGVNGKGHSSEIRISGLAETLTALKGFEPEVYKALNKSLRAPLKNLASTASARYGGTYKVKLRTTGKSVGGSVTAVMGPQKSRNDWTSPASKALVMEFAKNGKTPQARGMIDFFQSYFGSPGRFLWNTWDSMSNSVQTDIAESIKQAEAELQRRLDSAGEGY